MKQKVKYLTLAYLIFLLLFALSSSLEGVASDLIYILAFVSPVIFVFLVDRSTDAEEEKKLFRLTGESGDMVALTLGPSVVLVAALSFLTSYLIFITAGKTDSVNLGDSLVTAIVSYALVPCVIEELLFRYLPMRLLCRHNRRVAVILSSVFFALAPFSPFRLFYAFVAGVIFMSVDIAAGSIWPSVILHFTNTLLSVLWIMYGNTSGGKIALFVIICLLLCLSTVVFVLRRKDLKSKILYVFSSGEAYGLDPTPLMFIIPAAVLGASALL